MHEGFSERFVAFLEQHGIEKRGAAALLAEISGDGYQSAIRWLNKDKPPRTETLAKIVKQILGPELTKRDCRCIMSYLLFDVDILGPQKHMESSYDALIDAAGEMNIDLSTLPKQTLSKLVAFCSNEAATKGSVSIEITKKALELVTSQENKST